MSIIIVGAGHAAAQCVLNLKRENMDSSITVIGDEPYLPYMRPPLSKAFLQGEQGVEQLMIKPQSYYEDNNVTIINTRVTEIDKAAKKVSLENGRTLEYTKLILATGSRLRRLLLPGSELGGIHYLKNIADAEALKEQLGSAKNMVVCGGGYIGLEVAASARKAGLEVTVLEMADRVMQRVASSHTSAYFANLHAQQGVEIICNKTVSSFIGDGQVQSVYCDDGSEYKADIVVVGIGVIPETTLAEAAGLQIENGIVVNQYCQTSEDSIYAIGDCANHYNAIYAARLRLECVQNATGQAKTVAAHIAGKELPYDEVPWFWSDQYQTKLQIAGLLNDYDELVMRGELDSEQGYSVFALKAGVLIAIEAVKRPKDFMFGKGLIAKRVKPKVSDLQDANVALNTIA